MMRTNRRSSTLVVACLAAGALFSASGTGLAISGFASPGPAVRAQYPDAKDLAPNPERSDEAAEPVTLTDLIEERAAEMKRTPQLRADAARVERELQAALSTPSRAGVREYGSIPLLVAGIGLLALGSFLRARRGPVPV